MPSQRAPRNVRELVTIGPRPGTPRQGRGTGPTVHRRIRVALESEGWETCPLSPGDSRKHRRQRIATMILAGHARRFIKDAKKGRSASKKSNGSSSCPT